jgi:hypothetical protein
LGEVGKLATRRGKCQASHGLIALAHEQFGASPLFAG